MTVQKRNGEMVQILSADFQQRYEPQFAVGNIFSTFQMLHELRGFWPMSSINETGVAIDFSGQGRGLTNTAAVGRGITGLVPYAVFDGATNYFQRADEAGLDITGYLTIGAWLYPTAFGTNVQPMSKDGAAGQFSYHIQRTAGNLYQFQVSSDGGGGGLKAIDSASSYSSSAWHFVVGRFTISSEMSIFVNGVQTQTVAGIPAAIFNSNSILALGCFSNSGAPQRFWPGRLCLGFICAAALSNTVINNLFQQSRAAFGV